MTGGLAVTEDSTAAHENQRGTGADGESDEYSKPFSFSILKSHQAEFSNADCASVSNLSKLLFLNPIYPSPKKNTERKFYPT